MQKKQAPTLNGAQEKPRIVFGLDTEAMKVANPLHWRHDVFLDPHAFHPKVLQSRSKSPLLRLGQRVQELLGRFNPVAVLVEQHVPAHALDYSIYRILLPCFTCKQRFSLRPRDDV